MKGKKSNIKKVLDRADETDINEGRLSYFRYNEVLRNLADFYAYPLPAVVAVFAALSPNTDYQSNLRSCATVLKGHAAGVDRDYIKVSTYNHCRDRAITYLDGVAFLDNVRGKKIRSFYKNILNPIDSEPVTIDGHAVNIWRLKRVNLKAIVALSWHYETVAADYRRVAASVGLLPNQVQAITWFTWKRINRIVYPGRQLELFRDNSADMWKTFHRSGRHFDLSVFNGTVSGRRIAGN